MKESDKLIWVLSIIKANNFTFKVIHLEMENQRSNLLIKYLQHKYKGRRIILIWDGASYHKYGEFRDFLSTVNSDKEPEKWSITCILFTPNAPQQNPVEDIW